MTVLQRCQLCHRNFPPWVTEIFHRGKPFSDGCVTVVSTKRSSILVESDRGSIVLLSQFRLRGSEHSVTIAVGDTRGDTHSMSPSDPRPTVNGSLRSPETDPTTVYVVGVRRSRPPHPIRVLRKFTIVDPGHSSSHSSDFYHRLGPKTTQLSPLCPNPSVD